MAKNPDSRTIRNSDSDALQPRGCVGGAGFEEIPANPEPAPSDEDLARVAFEAGNRKYLELRPTADPSEWNDLSYVHRQCEIAEVRAVRTACEGAVRAELDRHTPSANGIYPLNECNLEWRKMVDELRAEEEG